MISHLTIQTAAQAAGGRLITGLVAGLVLLVLTALVLRVFRSSSTRFAIYFLTLVAIAVFPVAACFVSRRASGVESPLGVTVPSQWALALFGFWIVGASVELTRIVVGLWRLRLIRWRCVELGTTASLGYSAASALVEANAPGNVNPKQINAKRLVTLCISDDVSVPTAIGFFRPAILLPSWATTELSASELNSILLHELGHLRRWDDWTNLAQKLLQALLFFHPAVWWIDSRLALEREAACDDLVVAKTSDAHGYAKCLVAVAEKSVGRRAFSLTVAAVSRVRETAARLTRILDQNRPAQTRLSKPAIFAFATLTFALLVEVPRVPTIVAFGDATPATVAYQNNGVVNETEAIPTVIPASAQIETRNGKAISRPVLRNVELRTRGRSPQIPTRTNSPRIKRERINRVANENPKPSPTLVQASWNQATVAPTLLVLTQTVVCDAYGNCFISVRAWQLLTVQQTLDQSQNGNTAKSI